MLLHFISASGGREDGMILLDKVFRQQNDSVFLAILNDLRMGVVTPQAQRVLGGKVQESYKKDREAAQTKSCGDVGDASQQQLLLLSSGDSKIAIGQNGSKEGKDCKAGPAYKKGFAIPKAAEAPAVRPTKLFSTNKDVDTYNGAELEKLGLADADGDCYRWVNVCWPLAWRG